MSKTKKIVWLSVAGLAALLIIAGATAKPQQEVKNGQPREVQNEESTTTPTSTPVSADQGASTQAQKSDLVKVVSVVDGDTIKVLIDGTTKTVRLIGIDTPETVDPRKPVQCFGKEASDKTKTILSGKMVRLESDPTQGDLDKYQRLLRYVYLDDGTFFNKLLIQQGYAHEYTYEIPYEYQAKFKIAERTAREAQLGLWSPTTCNGDTTTAVASSTAQTQPTQSGSHIFYLSTYYTARYYYCDTDSGWKSLSPKYLKSYSSEVALLKDYPTQTLHEACK